MSASSAKRGLSYYLLAAFFTLFVVFLYGPMLIIFVLSFQGTTGGLTFPMEGLSLHWFYKLAEGLGVEIFAGMSCSEMVYDGSRVAGVVAGEFGLDPATGEPGPSYEPGMELRGKYVFLSEGVRGSLSKEVIAKYDLSKGKCPQKFGLGMKEIWEIDPAKHREGTVTHTMGWPLGKNAGGGSFIYHLENNQVYIGFVVHLNYRNPHLYPYMEFQRFKHHPMVAELLEGGKRVAYGARAISEGLASIRCGSCKAVVATKTCTWSPPISRARAPHSGTVAKTLSAAAAGMAAMARRTSNRSFMTAGS